MKWKVLNCIKANERDDVMKIFNSDIVYYLALLKLLVQRPKFDDAVNKLICFSDVSCKTFEKVKNLFFFHFTENWRRRKKFHWSEEWAPMHHSSWSAKVTNKFILYHSWKTTDSGHLKILLISNLNSIHLSSIPGPYNIRPRSSVRYVFQSSLCVPR